MTNIYITRHGQNIDNANGVLNGHRDLGLTDLGVAQAKELAQGMLDKKLSFDTVYVSPLLRAKQTADILCEALGLPAPVVMDDLIERDFGTMTGKPIADISTLCTDILKTDFSLVYFLSAEGAESFQGVMDRATRALKHIQEQSENKSVLVVGHGDLGKMMYGAYYGFDWKHMLTMFHFGNSELLLLSPDSSAEETHMMRIEQHNH